MTARVYFIQQGANGPIKVGITDNPDRRLAMLQGGNPDKLYLRAVLIGDLADEKRLHDAFAGGHIRGEWFAPDTPGLAETIRKAQHDEFWDEDLCERCREWPIPRGNRKYCARCSRSSLVAP